MCHLVGSTGLLLSLWEVLVLPLKTAFRTVARPWPWGRSVDGALETSCLLSRALCPGSGEVEGRLGPFPAGGKTSGKFR